MLSDLAGGSGSNGSFRAGSAGCVFMEASRFTSVADSAREDAREEARELALEPVFEPAFEGAFDMLAE
jgi:hypothetical protein